MKIIGVYYFPNSSKSIFVNLEIYNNVFSIYDIEGKLIHSQDLESLPKNNKIGGLPKTITFSNGSKFVADDSNLNYLPDSLLSNLLNALYGNFRIILLITIISPLAFWVLTFNAIPLLANFSAELVPQNTKVIISKRIKNELLESILNKSELPGEEQIKTIDLIDKKLFTLPLKNKYSLSFYDSDFLGANAIALPDGTIIFTDALVSKLKDYPDALIAVMLHEIGHVEHNHGIRSILETIGISMAFSYLIGDVQGISELIVGSSIGMLQLSFSRGMEKEADIFSIQNLKRLKIPEESLITGLEKIISSEDSKNDAFNKYLNSHPLLEERVNLVKSFD